VEKRMMIRLQRIFQVALIPAMLVCAGGFAQADLLSDHFGVTLSLDTSSSYTDSYQGLTSYPYDLDSFTPTKNTKTTNYIVGDWYGDWSSVTFDYTTRSGQYPSGGEPYDVEALYFDNDENNLYMSVVTSFEPSPGYTETREGLNVLVVTGDLALDLGMNDPYTDGFSYDYGVNINHEHRTGGDAISGGSTIGNEVYRTNNSDWYLGTPSGAPAAGGELSNFDPEYSGFGGSYLGAATVTYTQYDFGINDETLAPTYVIDITVPLDLLPTLYEGDIIGVGWVQGCRNDGNEVDAVMRLEGQFTPEPSTMALMALGMSALGILRRRKQNKEDQV
jgi:hypothetical protein